MTDDELAEAFKRGELVVVDVDDGTRRRLLAALDAIDNDLSYDRLHGTNRLLYR